MNSLSHIVACLAAGAAALLPLGVLAADLASGAFQYNKDRMTMADAYAFTAPDTFDAAKKATVVILTTTKIERKEVDGALDRESAISAQMREAKGTTIQLTFGADWDLYGLNVQIRTETGSQSLSSSGSAKVDLKTKGPDRVAGRVYTDEKKKIGDDTYEFDLKFDVPITPEPSPGKPLPEGGGDAGKAYVAYIAAMQQGDVEGIARYWPKEKAAKMLEARKEPDFKDKLEMIKAFSPKSVTVKGGALKGDTADLDVVGKDSDGNIMDGKVRMARDGKDWRVEKENLTTHTK